MWGWGDVGMGGWGPTRRRAYEDTEVESHQEMGTWRWDPIGRWVGWGADGVPQEMGGKNIEMEPHQEMGMWGSVRRWG